MYELEPKYTCAACGALFQDEDGIEAHREQEHIEETQGEEGRSKEHSAESTRPSEPAP